MMHFVQLVELGLSIDSFKFNINSPTLVAAELLGLIKVSIHEVAALLCGESIDPDAVHACI